MGMSASQVRMLSLTSRLSDIELSAQSISNSKIRLADASTDASKNYQEALDKQKLTVFNSTTSAYVDANAYNLTTYNAISTLDKQRFLSDSSNRILVTDDVYEAWQNAGDLNQFLTALGIELDEANQDYDLRAIDYYTNIYNQIAANGCHAPGDEYMMDSEWLYNQLNNGNIYLSEWDSNGGENGDGSWERTSWSSGDTSLVVKNDDINIAKAEAEYETTMAEIEAKEKKFDLSLKSIDTEHNAVQTEIDSVKKVIDKNIERTFKIFNG